MTDVIYQIGSIPMTVRSLDARAADGIASPFVALLPAFHLARMPATTAVVPQLLRAGCSDVILAGPHAEAYQKQIGSVLEQHGAKFAASPYDGVDDGCNAALLTALIRKAGVALCADVPELLEALQLALQANGWTVAAAPSQKARRPTQPGVTPSRHPTLPGITPLKTAKRPTPAAGAPAKGTSARKTGQIAKPATPTGQAKPTKPTRPAKPTRRTKKTGKRR